MKGNLMRKNLMFVGGIIMIFTLASCGGTQKRTVVNYTPREVEQANQVMTYYNTSLALLKNVVVEKDVNAVLGYMEQSGKAPALTAIAPPAFSQKDSAFVVNPGPYFNEETRSNLKQNYFQLFQARRQFYSTFDMYISYLKSDNKMAADKLLSTNYQLSVEMSEYKENITDILSPFADEAQKVLLNDNPMKEQLLSMKRMAATMHSILALCIRKPIPDTAHLDMKLAKLVIQLDIAKRLPTVEGHPEEMKKFQNFLTHVESFIKDVQHIKTKGTYTEMDMTTIEEYGVSLD
ncbi:hypothetical protein DXC10_08320 [Bacteroides sp. OM08-11]|nr:hypothetical protein DXC10_08320 [Bacteroides sp. OM08-11]